MFNLFMKEGVFMKPMPVLAWEDKSMNPLPLEGNMQMTNSDEYNTGILDKYFVGKIVKVYWSSLGHKLNANDQGSFVTSMCIKGKLEHIGHWFRVLVENSTYAYFGYKDVLTMLIRSKESNRPNSISLRSKDNEK